MKIDCVVVSSNLNETYLSYWPRVYESWLKLLGVGTYLVLVADSIPDELEYPERVILFPPIENMSTAYQAQCVRLLVPALLNNLTVLVSDVDIVPANESYFVDNIKNIPDDHFVSYRDAYFKNSMCAICYNAAKSNTWGEIFGISRREDVSSKLKEWYNPQYDGKKNGPGWYTDQQTLFKILHEWEKTENGAGRWNVLKDSETGFKRLDKRQRQYISHFSDTLRDELRRCIYTDFHMIRPYTKPRVKGWVDRVIKLIHSSSKK